MRIRLQYCLCFFSTVDAVSVVWMVREVDVLLK